MVSEQKRLFLTGAGLVLLFLVSFYCSYQYFKPFEKIKIHDRQIQLNPSAAIDPNKEYFLRLWDYDLPLQNCNYRGYLEKAIAGFRKLHPKIKVELRLLDLTSGPAELETALEQNDPPDVYGSIFNLPQFDYRYQVPVGPYLDKRKLPALYLPQVLRLASIDNVLCSFPRVVRFNIWIGNPGLMKTAGLSVAEIQRKGWTWAQLFAAKDRYPTGVYTLAGHVIPIEVLRQILPHGCFIEGKGGGTAWDWLQTLKDTQRLPEDFNSNMLGRFLSGKVMILAGAKPLLLRALRARLARDKAGWEPVALPPPNLNAAQPVCPVEIGGVSIYRNPKRNHGSDHVAAAVALGKYLSQYPDARPWEEMLLIPAGARVKERWCKSGSAGEVAVLEALVAQGGFTDWKTPPVYPEHISRALLEYLTGVIPREKVIERFKTEMACD